MTPPGALTMDDVYPLAERTYRNMRRVAPRVASSEVGEDVVAAIERVIAYELEVDSLVEERDFDAVFAAIERADLSNAPVGFDPETWNGVCWWGSLHGHPQRATGACEATVLPDTTNLARRDSRGLARALVGDIDGAIEDFSYVVENAADGDFLDICAGWLDELRAGENPFTEEVMEELKN
jgi:hypothetical protein